MLDNKFYSRWTVTTSLEQMIATHMCIASSNSVFSMKECQCDRFSEVLFNWRSITYVISHLMMIPVRSDTNRIQTHFFSRSWKVFHLRFASSVMKWIVNEKTHNKWTFSSEMNSSLKIVVKCTTFYSIRVFWAAQLFLWQMFPTLFETDTDAHPTWP